VKEAEAPLFLRKAAKYVTLAVLALLAGIAAAFLFAGLTARDPETPAAVEDQAGGGFIRHTEPRTIPDIAFKDAEGQTVLLSDWRGHMVLLNLWATWCAPCKTEMPSLDRLQAKLGGKGVAVLALSTDRGGPKLPAEFFDREGITHLKLYNDNTGEAAITMKAAGLPLTAIVNEDGQEIARLVGPAQWDSPEMIARLEAMVARDVNGRGTARPSP
jgi:thiol-disulfide isomerase/thioredoxin